MGHPFLSGRSEVMPYSFMKSCLRPSQMGQIICRLNLRLMDLPEELTARPSPLDRTSRRDEEAEEPAIY